MPTTDLLITHAENIIGQPSAVHVDDSNGTRITYIKGQCGEATLFETPDGTYLQSAGVMYEPHGGRVATRFVPRH